MARLDVDADLVGNSFGAKIVPDVLILVLRQLRGDETGALCLKEHVRFDQSVPVRMERDLLRAAA